MTITYDANEYGAILFWGFAYSAVWRVVRRPRFLGTLLFYATCCVLSHYTLCADDHWALVSSGHLTYGLGALGSVLTFNLTFFNNHCYRRFLDNWKAAMVAWSRLNDLGLQLYAHVAYDTYTACEVLRLLHAANHFVMTETVLKLGRQSALDVCAHRGLLTAEEVAFLSSKAAVNINGAYQCVCWGLQMVANEVHAGRLTPAAGNRIDASIVQWREAATLPPLIQATPVPFVYFHTMAFLLFIFHFGLSARLSLSAVAEDPLTHGDTVDSDVDEEAVAMHARSTTFVLNLTVASLVEICLLLAFNSLFEMSSQLADPWGSDAIDLPAGEYLLKVLSGHKALFAGATLPGHPRLGRDGIRGGHLTSSPPSPSAPGAAPGAAPDAAPDAAPGADAMADASKRSIFLEPLPSSEQSFLRALDHDWDRTLKDSTSLRLYKALAVRIDEMEGLCDGNEDASTRKAKKKKSKKIMQQQGISMEVIKGAASRRSRRRIAAEAGKPAPLKLASQPTRTLALGSPELPSIASSPLRYLATSSVATEAPDGSGGCHDGRVPTIPGPTSN